MMNLSVHNKIIRPLSVRKPIIDTLGLLLGNHFYVPFWWSNQRMHVKVDVQWCLVMTANERYIY